MLRVVRVVGSAERDVARAIDSVILKPDQRRVQSALLTGVNGTLVDVMLPDPVMLRMGDALELDDGSFVEIVIEAEPLVEVRGNDLTHLARLAWHLGDRHVPVQILANRLRMRRDPSLETLLGNLGARLTPIEAPFDPEGGAYASGKGHGHQGTHLDHDHHHHGPGRHHHHD